MNESYGGCRYGLQRISPLLSNVVAVQEGGQVQMAFTPQGMVLPAEKISVQIQPMRLVVGRGDFVSKIVDLLGLKDGSGRCFLVHVPLHQSWFCLFELHWVAWVPVTPASQAVILHDWKAVDWKA